jgi:tRNA modification GTPase
VIEARTDADLSAALKQLAGGVSRPLDIVRDDLLNLLADVEAGLDFVDEDIEFVPKAALIGRLAAGIAHLTNLLRQLDARSVAVRPVRVALVGRPNAGKSSLFNALTGGTALVSPAPGTTRDYLTATLEIGGQAVELADTAGWEAAADGIAEQAQRLGRERAAGADVVLWCAGPGDEFTAPDVARLAATGADVIRVRTKADLPNPPADGVACSTVAAGGTSAVRDALADAVRAVARPPLAPSQSRCRAHVTAAADHLRAAHQHAVFDDPPELVAATLRAALDQIGEVAGTVYTNDLLDRIFTRFCIGK